MSAGSCVASESRSRLYSLRLHDLSDQSLAAAQKTISVCFNFSLIHLYFVLYSSVLTATLE